jgi:hypothetical protein
MFVGLGTSLPCFFGPLLFPGQVRLVLELIYTHLAPTPFFDLLLLVVRSLCVAHCLVS